MRHLGCSLKLQHLLFLLLCRSCWLSVHSKVHESSVSRSQHCPSIDVTTKRCNSFVPTHISCSRHPSNNNDETKTHLAISSSSEPYPLDDDGRPIDIKSNQHLLNGLQTPHSGRKFTPTHPSSSSSRRSRLRSKLSRLLRRNNRRFTEGWYYRLTLPEYNESFVFIFSIEDAGRFIKGEKSPLTLACMQLLGPDDTYLVQSDEDDTKFWGWKYAQGLGCTFEWNKDDDIDDSAKRIIAAMTPEEWRDRVKTGFQILPFHLQGRLDGHDGTLGGVKSNQGVAGKAEYDISLRPVAGWGQYPPLSSQLQHQNETTSTKQTYSQFSTAGWLAKFPVFEPHWQITMAHARATGSLNWNGTVYEFKDAPFYGEKNWGGAFPTKWYWSQCNSFDDYPDLSFTAGGGIRILPFSFLPGKRTETLGLIGIHYQGSFYEFVPWTSESEWEVDPWGTWKFRGRCTDNKGGKQYEADIVVTTEEDVPGVLLRAPTKDEGMQYFCRDSGFGNAVVSLWEMEWDDNARDYIRSPNKPPLIDKATSRQCTVEVGGGPWWTTWKVKSQMSPILKKLIRLPYAFRRS
eukprot:scaffold2944_cov155-Skeletonema_dohrnii-CCMP3373.AAC.16